MYTTTLKGVEYSTPPGSCFPGLILFIDIKPLRAMSLFKQDSFELRRQNVWLLRSKLGFIISIFLIN
jgi:hypothetical protein